ncbi:hypothetical protein OQH61_09390, partial [Helicobacter sp. MIT 21-1697]|uniref:MBOAT family O-acyltransferase n=1 Tax=Helicobacter sp. MIT 21-1697 TaxID=2993733 RepID=UPI00224AE106
MLGIIFNLSVLGFFKYTDFFLENFNLFAQLLDFNLNIPLPHILLPLALSFVTFQQIAFLVDCYKRVNIRDMQEVKERNLKEYLLAEKALEERVSKGDLESQSNKNLSLAQRDSQDIHKEYDTDKNALTTSKDTQAHLQSKESMHNEQSPQTQINFLDYALFICFFPQLIAGPIVHHKEMMPQFHSLFKHSNPIKWDYMAKGIFIFSIGLFKKVFIADAFAKWANAGFSVVESGGVLNIAESWATSLSYTFQLYFDFSGYCDMAIGLGLLFGIMLPINFNSPYKALNISEFWRRWHMTLGRFLKEYVYIPLGGNKNTKYKQSRFYNTLNKILTLRNLFIVAFLSGIWHGAGWGFVIWGSLHGSAMIIHRSYRFFLESSLALNTSLMKLRHTRVYTILCWLLTFNFVNIAWIFFRSENVSGAMNLITGMFGITWVELPQKIHHLPALLEHIGGRN